MTIDERLNKLISSSLPYATVREFKEQVRVAFVEIARDQREACANAVDALQGAEVRRRDAYLAVKNADITRESKTVSA